MKNIVTKRSYCFKLLKNKCIFVCSINQIFYVYFFFMVLIFFFLDFLILLIFWKSVLGFSDFSIFNLFLSSSLTVFVSHSNTFTRWWVCKFVCMQLCCIIWLWWEGKVFSSVRYSYLLTLPHDNAAFLLLLYQIFSSIIMISFHIVSKRLCLNLENIFFCYTFFVKLCESSKVLKFLKTISEK